MRESTFLIPKRLPPRISNQSINNASFLPNADLCSGDTYVPLSKAGDDYEDQERIQLRCFFRAGIEICLIKLIHASEIVRHGP